LKLPAGERPPLYDGMRNCASYSNPSFPFFSSISSRLPLHHLGHIVGSCLNAASAASPNGFEALFTAAFPWMERLDYLAASYVLSVSSPAFPFQETLAVLPVIDQPQRVRALVSSLLPHARDASIGVSAFPHEWHSLINYLCASCHEASADEYLAADVLALLASADICVNFAAHFRHPNSLSFSQCHFPHVFCSSVFSFFLPPPSIILSASFIDRASAVLNSSSTSESGSSDWHWMRLWKATIHLDPTRQGQAMNLASDITSAMMSCDAAVSGDRGRRVFELSALFRAHPASRSLHAAIT
jgi:hypothetical protein